MCIRDRFDENGALLSAPARLADALRRRDWQRLFVGERDAWRDAELTLFGHALLDKLTVPRKPITAHVLIVDRDSDVLAPFTADRLAAKPFAALPVLGVPGWWSGNEAPGFYADPAVFRTGSIKTKTAAEAAVLLFRSADPQVGTPAQITSSGRPDLRQPAGSCLP